TDTGAAYCWGLNHLGQLGDGTLDNAWEPRAVAGDVVFASISAGGAHTCGVSHDGAAYCWGSNAYGELGIAAIHMPREPGATVPEPVFGGVRFVAISAGEHVTCGIDDVARGLCWGRGTYGQLGIGEAVNVA